MTSNRQSAFRKFCAAVLAAALALQPVGMYAATSPLAELPLQGLNTVKPNIMYTMDDSQSMRAPTLPDYLTTNLNLRYCRDPDGLSALCRNQDPLNGNAPYAGSAVNKIYYDPTITYAVSVRSDGTPLPYFDASRCSASTSWQCVYPDGFAGYPNANPGTAIDLSTSYPDEVFCWKPDAYDSSAPTPDDLTTAQTDGSVCRFNGRDYKDVTVAAGYTAVGVSAGYNYPNSAATANCTHSATSKCVFTGLPQPTGPNPFPSYPGYPFKANPYYYTVSQVMFCSARDASGWGDRTSTCGDRWTPATPYVSYGTSDFDPAAFARIDIVPTTPTYSGRPNRSDCAAAPVCTYAEEMANIARWYAFARTRLLAMKTAGGIAFSALDQNSRVGFNTLNSYSTKFRNVQDFKDPYKSDWFTNFYSTLAFGQTPSLDAMWRIGEYFSNRGGAAGLPGATDPLDPVTGKCQQNYHLLSTDGYWNQIGSTPFVDRIGDQDATVKTAPPSPVPGFTQGADLPPPYREDPANPTSSTMSDYAMFYWINDIRPELPNNVKDTIAPWQHVTFYGLSIGAEGTLPYPTGINNIVLGAAAWPKPLNNTATAIDDLWHAALNSRGRYFDAQNAQQLAESVVSALADFTDQAGTGAGVGLAGAQFATTTKYGYRTSYEVGWWGDVRKYALNAGTGAIDIDKDGNPLSQPVWAAAAQLDAQASGNGWDTNRRIVTVLDENTNVARKGVPFRLSSLAKPQTDSLANAWALVTPRPSAQQVLNYLRGDNSNEGTGTTNFRIRSHVLGDIVYSGAVPVGAPSQPYVDATDPGYSTFVANKASRTPMVYVGANDGMLHAFVDSSTVDAGKEAWAYVPKALFSAVDPNDLDPNAASFQLGALSYRRGGIPLFKHRFYVNATPRVWDVDFANTSSTPLASPAQAYSPDWHTILVGGLGAGGRAVYALDVTNPVQLTDSETAAAGHVLWEFTDPTLGYVFDAPTLVKTSAYGWVVLVASGYDNPGGQGFLYVLNPTNGQLIQKLALPGDTGNDADPTGLSTIRAFTASRKNAYALQAYGGDLKGNVWRFDLSLPAADWQTKGVSLIAKLTDASGHAQPITTGVRIEVDQNNNVDRYLFVGTGKLLDQTDLGDSSVTNSLYVIRDGTVSAPDPAPAQPYTRADLNTVDAACVDSSTAPCIVGTKTRGWYQDATDSKQKIITDVVADVNTVVAVFSRPSDDPCDAAISSALYARNFTTGNSVLLPPGGTIPVSVISDIGAVAGATLIKSASGDIRLQVTTMQPSPKYGQVFSFDLKLSTKANLSHRVSWRLLNRD